MKTFKEFDKKIVLPIYLTEKMSWGQQIIAGEDM